MVARRSALALALTLATSVPGVACTDFNDAPSARWRVDADGPRRWLVTPCGARFFSLGVNVVTGGSPARRYLGHEDYFWGTFYPDYGEWLAATRARLGAWGFNSAGGWSLDSDVLGLPFLPNLELGRQAKFHWFDPFAPAAEDRMRAAAVALVAPSWGNPYRIGYFTDNEVGWWNGPLFTFFMKKPADNVTKQTLVALVRRQYGDSWEAFTRDFVPPPGVTSFDGLLAATGVFPQLRPGGTGIRVVRRWTGEIAGRYYRLVREALTTADPDALVFGDRLPIYYDPDAVRAMAPYVDAIATNYNVDSPEGWVSPYFFDGLRTLTGDKPVLISEWFFAARENRSGNRNNGHLMTVDTQAERTRGALAAAERFARDPSIVGLHWFQYADHPRGGRRDGEDYNFGLIDTQNRPYEELTTGFARINPRLARLHAEAALPPGPPDGPVALPRVAVDTNDHSLREWPKETSRVRGLAAPAPEIPFGDLYLAWNAAGLALATISMDYYDQTLLAWQDEFPRGEAFRIDWGIDAGTGPRRFAMYFIPPREHDTLDRPTMRVELCRMDGSACTPVPDAVASYFGADQPRLTAEVVLPWAALGLQAPPDGRLRMALAATAFFRSRWMSWGGRPPAETLAEVASWHVVTRQEPEETP